MAYTSAKSLQVTTIYNMNPNRFAEDRDFASDVQGYGMRMNVFSRVFEIDRHLDQVQSSIEKLRIFRDKHEEGTFREM